ncbi:CrcB family protein [Microbacterium lacus]|uniref:fluoride efflux transporter FluC n=1 Tax=Microbacterium lacus TaxID=415217 RepID=UPI0038504948
MSFTDPERGNASQIAQPLFARPRLIVAVFIGGALGTFARESTVLVVAAQEGVPWGILLVNMVGAFSLGVLLGALGARDTETPVKRDVRLFFGTGVLGGFTTYSALATDTALLLESDPLAGSLYAVGSVIAGIALAALGVWVGSRVFPRRADSQEVVS